MEFLLVLLSYILLLFISLLFLFFLFCLSKHDISKNTGFKQYPFIGTLPEFLTNRHRFLDWTTAVLSRHPSQTAVFFRPGKVHGVITANPRNVEHILKTQFSNYPKGPRFISHLHDFLGNGIFNSDDQLWQLQRKTASFEFNKRSLKTFILNSVGSEIGTRLIPLFKKVSESGQTIDLQNILEMFAFDNVCLLAFNVDPSCLSGHGPGRSEFMKAFEDAAMLSSQRFMYVIPGLWKLEKILNFGPEKRLRESIRIVHDFADEIIQSRWQDKKHYNDLLSRFILQENSSSNQTEHCNFLRDVVISFILAGRDTTSSGLSWFFWLLSLHPNVLKKIRSEVMQVRVGSGLRVGETYDFDELKEMNYLHGAISEALRLYPPVPIDTRVCLNDDILPDGTEIKRDWFVTYHTFAMGRMESIWGQDCLEFRPERWLDESGLYKADSPFRYPIFHAGPRTCLGKEMAYIQMKMIVACVVELFDIQVLNKETSPEILLSLTLRMKHGLPVRVKVRDFENYKAEVNVT